MFLLDTNIFLEILMEQERAEAAKDLFTRISPSRLFITDFSLHSLGVLLFRRNQHQVYERFVDDALLNTGIAVLRLSAEDIPTVVAVAQRFQLDFDDAYQYVAAENHGLQIVSFDADFDRTERGRRSPDKIQR